MTEPDDAVIPVPSPGETLWFGEQSAPVVVVLHDGYGRLAAVLDYCAALSAHGFRVAAPDLYGGVGTTDAAGAERLMAGLALEPALSLIDDCVAAAAGSRLGVIGFAVGGWLALAHAQTGASDAVVAYYATLGPETAAVLPCPVLLHFAEIDEWEDDEEPDAFVARLKDHGTPVARHDYLATVHSFANAAIPELYEPRAAALAFARTAGFLQRELLD
ncbi:dienelactone hydrolase family protein [Lysobacter korlensis]|uniref:Dienelactone hydrolase family protein n=1 Tax=Lysobacter korlensis TaxID=553636 RepID=A0ABV6RVD2_9GAMM